MTDNRSTNGHGGPFLDAAKLLDLMIKNGYKMGDPILLAGCNTGNGSSSLAHDLAILAGATVGGPSTCLWDGSGGIYGSKPDPLKPGEDRADSAKPGRIRWWGADGKEKLPISWHPAKPNGGQRPALPPSFPNFR